MTDFSQTNCWLNIDKPIAMSSARAVAIVKRLTKAKKVGHGGTLDPFASGILPIALNKATKTAESMMQKPKKYLFTIKWGEFRDTDDIEGKVERSSEKRPTNSELIFALQKFIGKIKQKPSKFSAIKINGKRAYDLARSGIEFEMKLREVEIFSLKLISNSADSCVIEAKCSKGTYIRTLARDICESLGVCGFVSVLTRLEVGEFLYKNKISLEKLKNITKLGGVVLDGSLFHINP